MATIKAGWKRVVQVKPYESETLELSVEKEINTAGMNLVEEAVALDRVLAKAGDELVIERMQARAGEIATTRRLGDPARPSPADDPYLR